MTDDPSNGIASQGDRLSEEHRQSVSDRAALFQQQVLAIAHQKTQGHEQANFFPVLFRIAAEAIETDVNEFCDHAALVFEEIEAFGKEPQPDEDWNDWLQELTGEKDSFYFSTDSLVNELPPLPGKKRGRKTKPPSENEMVEAVQQAVEQAEDALSVAHQENPTDWIHRIAEALGDNQGTASFGLLRQTTGLSRGALFLGLLLGQDNWTLWQEYFYGEVVVRSRT